MKILHLISSPRCKAPFSIKLGESIIQKSKSDYTNAITNFGDLTHTNFPHLEEAHLDSFFTQAEQRRAKQISAIKHADAITVEINDADILVISAPMYDFVIHSTFETSMDHIARAGITFTYTDDGTQGLIKNKKVFPAIAIGGIYSEGPYKTSDFTEAYLRTMLGFIEIKDATAFGVEVLSLDGVQDSVLGKAMADVDRFSFSLETGS